MPDHDDSYDQGPERRHWSNGSCACRRYPAPTAPLSTSSQRWRLKPKIGPPAKKYGLEYAEEFHYIGPDRALDEYLSQHAVSL